MVFDISLFSFLYQYFRYPAALALIPFAVLIVWLLARKDWVAIREDEKDPKYLRKRALMRRIILFTRSLILIVLLVALASPYVERETTVKGDPFIKILVDNSTSFKLFDASVADRIKEALEKEIKVEMRTLASGDKSALGDGILSNIRGEENILLITDGHNNFGAELGDVALFVNRLNGTINALELAPEKADASVRISGPSKTLGDVENIFAVHIQKAGEVGNIQVKVYVDDRLVIDGPANEGKIEIMQSFSGGYHRIRAEITPQNDQFLQNNVYYKTVKVVPKPKLIYLTDKEAAPLFTLLNQLYDVQKMSSLPPDLKDIHGVIVDDMNAQRMESYVERLVDFISEGDGMLVVGGRNSYDLGGYKDSKFEQLVPVQIAQPGKEQGDINIVVVMDISGSTGAQVGDGKGALAVDVEKALVLNIITEDLRPENKVAVVAFNSAAFTIAPLLYLFEHTGLVERVKRLRDGGGTFIGAGLARAITLLKPADGSKNIILVSDGITQLSSDSLGAAQLAQRAGIKIFTVGVGARTNENIMKRIAQIGNGVYFRAGQENRLKLLFGDVEEGEKTSYSLTPLDSNHFITQDIEIGAFISGFNTVVPKSTGRMLVTTDVADPILVVWRYGLGRVASWLSDNGERWAGEVLSRKNSHLVTRIINWIAGDPERKAETFISVQDTRVGTPTKILVKSPGPPKAENVQFYKESEDLYYGTIMPAKTGFQNLLDAVFAVNYPLEFEGVGMNSQLESVVGSTGGRMFLPEQTKEIIRAVKSRSKRTILQKQDVTWPFIILATIIFLVEMLMRRMILESRNK